MTSSGSNGTRTSSFSEDSSPPTVFAPPTGPKVWRELQARSHSQNSQGRSSPSFQHRPRHTPPGRVVTVPSNTVRTFATNVARPTPGPAWRKGDPIVFANRAVRPSARRNFSESDVRGQPVRNVSVPPVEEPAPAMVGTTRRKKKSKQKGGPEGTDDSGGTDVKLAQLDSESLLRIQQLGSLVSDNLALLEAEMKNLALRSENWKEMHALAVEISTKHASLLLATAKSGMVTSKCNAVGETATNGSENDSALIQDEEPPYIPMTYQIPADILEAKMKLGNDDMGKNWSHVDFCSPEGHPVTLHYCQTVEECEKILPKYLNEPVVGFDMEWCFPNVGKSPRKNVSLIQVANESSIALIHIGRMNKEDGTPESDDKLVPPTLRALLETDKIMKVGVNIGGDARRLRTFLDVKSQGMLELSDLHHVVYCAQENEKVIPKRLIALKRLTEYHMSLPLDKGEVRTSDWCAPITTEQMGYAATDAYVGLRLFDVLEMKRSKLHPKPRLPIFKGGDPENPSEPGYSGPEAPYVGTTRTASPKKPPHPAVAKANAWIDCYLAEHTSAIPGKAALRAWAMWHVFGHDVPAICALCREPPLQPSTVVGYILEAVWKDQLPYDPARLHAVIEMLQPMRRPSYAWMLTRSADDEAVKVVGDYGLA